MSVPEIETDRLLLRAFTSADRQPFAAMNADPEVMIYMSRSLDRSGSDLFLARIQDHWDAHGFGLWAIERRDDGAFLGFAGLSAPSFEALFMPAVEVGWRLARTAWGHGYATEAGAAALDHGFEALGLAEIVSFTAVCNERSRRVMERLGARRESPARPRARAGPTRRAACSVRCVNDPPETSPPAPGPWTQQTPLTSPCPYPG